MPAPLLCASSRGGPGALHGCLHVETKACPTGYGERCPSPGHDGIVVASPPCARGQEPSPKLKEKRCICCLALEFKPLLQLHFSNCGSKWHFKLLGIFVPNFLFLLTSYLWGFDLNFEKLCLFRTYCFHCKLFSPYKYPSLWSTTEK